MECTIILCRQCTDVEIDSSRLLLENFSSEDLYWNAQKKIQQVYYEYQEEGKIHNPYSQEMREQGSIRRGDLEGLEKSLRESYVGEAGRLAKDPLRDIKNKSIVVITLACRSAIAGGIHPEIAFSVSDAYIQRIEEMSNYSEVATAARQAEIYYTTLVQQHLNSRDKNPLVVRCRAIVQRCLQPFRAGF